MDASYDHGLFELHDAVIKKVNILQDGIVISCVFMGHERVSITFREEEADKQDIPDLTGRTINYMTVYRDGYRLHLMDHEDEVFIKASSYSVEWE